VYDDLAAALDGRFACEPWTGGRVTGLLDFPDFQVAPGSRRGVLLDDAADAFARAVETVLAPAVRAALADDDRRRAAAMEADLVQKLERTFRDLPREAPEYDFLAVAGARDARMPGGPPEGTPVASAAEEAGAAAEEPATLLPPGPLAHVEIVPARAKVERWAERPLRARARDAAGVRVREATYAWSLVEGDGELVATAPDRATFRAGGAVGRTRVAVVARAGGREARAEGVVEVVEAVENGARAGIPEPAFVSDPRGEWRSRIVDARWQVNSAHRDFLSVEASPRRKLRYLTALLAKEIVLHSYPAPQGGPLLERLVGVLTLTERRLERS